MLNCIKMGYYVLEFFIGVGNRDIMTKELSLICLFFVFFCLSIYYPILIPCCLFKQGLFCSGTVQTGTF